MNFGRRITEENKKDERLWFIQPSSIATPFTWNGMALDMAFNNHDKKDENIVFEKVTENISYLLLIMTSTGIWM
jgi:hypothetical protein